MIKSFKYFCSKIHLYGGLWFGVLLILLSVTGSILVFEHEIDRFLNPELLEVSDQNVSNDASPPVDRLIQEVKQQFPEKTISFVNLPDHDRQTAEFWLGTEDNYTYVYVNPYTAEITGHREGHSGFIHFIFGLHKNLLSGNTGFIIVGISGILMLLMGLSGIVLWWPKWSKIKKSVSIAFKRKFKRVNYDLHRAVGFWTALFLFLSAGTGTALVFYAPIESFLHGVFEDNKTEQPALVSAKSNSTDTQFHPFEQALSSAQERFPQARATYLYLPQTDTGVITVRMRQPSEWHPNGRSFVYLDQYRITPVHVHNALTAPTATSFMNLMYPLHIGSFGGIIMKWIYFILGLTPALLSVTGFIIWYLRRKKKRKKHAD